MAIRGQRPPAAPAPLGAALAPAARLLLCPVPPALALGAAPAAPAAAARLCTAPSLLGAALAEWFN